ncbi:MAG TPA: STAS domain-containing protein [bacterium]|nr:STAS domain-containing protein [bacterium]
MEALEKEYMAITELNKYYGCIVVSMSGDLTFDRVDQMRKNPDFMYPGKKVPIIVDLTNVEFIDSRGVAYLIYLSRKHKDDGIAFAGASGPVKKVIHRLCPGGVIRMFYTLEIASRELRKLI